MENKEFHPKFEEEVNFEKEPLPEKVIFFIRHPSVKWFNRLIEQADAEGKDIETYMPVDQEGLKMIGMLSDYLKENLSEMIKDENGNPRKFKIFTSPLKRAESEAKIISKNLKLSHVENSEIPIPENNEPLPNDYFVEMPIPYTKEETFQLIEEAKQKGIPATELLYTKGPERIAKTLEGMRERVQQSLDFLKSTDTPVSLVFAHRAIIALHLWLVEQIKTGREDLKITEKDIPSFVEIARNIPFTSISEVDLIKDKFLVKEVGRTPHLNPELRKGTF